MRTQIRAALGKVDGLKFIPYVASAMGEKGTPDMIGCYQGRMFLIEAKAEDGQASPIQLRRIAEWSATGARVGIARNADEALGIVFGYVDA